MKQVSMQVDRVSMGYAFHNWVLAERAEL